MLNTSDYIRLSLENNLFWLRIMKEHAIFIESSMPLIHRQLANQANQFRQQLDRLFAETIRLADNSVSDISLQSGQFYTRYTEAAELTTERWTGIEINRNLTRAEYDIQPLESSGFSPEKEQAVSRLNQSIINLVTDFIQFKSNLFNAQASCQLFTFLYTSVYRHILHEAQKYKEILISLQDRNENYNNSFVIFWNSQMEDHAKVLRGLFDPVESEYYGEADFYAQTFYSIINSATAIKEEIMDATRNFAEFLASVTEDLLECQVKSLLTPLFTDHLLREANYYLFLLQL